VLVSARQCARKCARHPVDLRGCLSEHARIDDGIASINRFGLVAYHAHRGRARDPGPFEISHRCPPKVVRDSARAAGGLAGRLPSATKTSDAFPIAVKNERHNAVSLLQSFMFLAM